MRYCIIGRRKEPPPNPLRARRGNENPLSPARERVGVRGFMQYILSIDQGTTGTRAIVYDSLGTQIACAYQELSQHFPQPGWVEHDPNEIWQGVLSTVHSALEQVPDGSIVAIGITNQRETTIVWDKGTGEPVCNAIVWQCRRTAGRCDELHSMGQADSIQEATGLPVDAYFSATKIEWVLRNVPGAMEKARQGRLLFGTSDTWILWNLTGGKVHATDFTNASRTMLLNLETLAWDDDILRLFDIPKSMLPEVRKSSGSFGETIAIGNIPDGIPISGIAGDQQAALFGQTCFEPGTVKNTYGTGSFILLNVGKNRPRSEHGLIVTVACDGLGEPVYALEGAVFVAGAAIQWLRDGLGLLASAAESEQMAIAAESNAGVYFVPALVGLGAPYWDQDARGSIFGITRGATANHLVRAALEAMCYQTRDVLQAMCKDSGLAIDSLKVDGGAVANNFLCQFQADVLGIDVVRPGTIETTALGAAYLAGLAVGFWGNCEEIRAYWRKDRSFSPCISKAEADTLYCGWQDAIRRTLTH